MASGSVSGSIISGNYAIRVDWSTIDNVANNSSQISATMYLVQASSWSLDIWPRECAIWVNGTKYTFNSPEITNSGGTTTRLGSITSNAIAHNADGSKQVQIAAEFNIQATISGTYYSKITISNTTITLTTLARATQHSLSASSVNMGSKVTINTPRASSSFTHELAYSFAGGSYVTFATGVATSYSWTVPNLASSIPNATSGTMTIRCITKNGSTTIGTKTVTMTAVVPSSVVPVINSVTLTEATSGLAAQFGAFIQGHSRIKAAISASGAGGSTIKSVTTTFAGYTYTGTSWTSYTVTSSGPLSMVTTVTDSRGRSASKTTTVSVLAYNRPAIKSFYGYRCDEDGTANDSGEYAWLWYNYEVTSLNNKNTLTVQIQSKTSAETSWTTRHTLTGYSASGSVVLGVFTLEAQHDIRLVVADYFVTINPYLVQIPTDDVIMDIYKDGTGIAFRKVAESANSIEFGEQVVMRAPWNYVQGKLVPEQGIYTQDTRGTNMSPIDYIKMGRGVYYEFKQCSYVALNSTADTYGHVTTYVRWSDSSGGFPIQEIRVGDGAWQRVGTSDETWSSWEPMYRYTPWVSASNCVRYKIVDGICFVRGYGNASTAAPAKPEGTQVGTLPVGYRPPLNIVGPLSTMTATIGQYTINTDGTVIVNNFNTSNPYWAFMTSYPL